MLHHLWEGGAAVYLAHRASQWGFNASGRSVDWAKTAGHVVVAVVWPSAALIGLVRAGYRLATGK